MRTSAYGGEHTGNRSLKACGIFGNLRVVAEMMCDISDGDKSQRGQAKDCICSYKQGVSVGNHRFRSKTTGFRKWVAAPFMLMLLMEAIVRGLMRSFMGCQGFTPRDHPDLGMSSLLTSHSKHTLGFQNEISD